MYLASTNYYTPPDTQNVVKSATYPWTNAQISSGLQLGPLCKPCDDGHALSLACYVFDDTAVCLYIFFSVFLAETSLFLSGKGNGKVFGF